VKSNNDVALMLLQVETFSNSTGIIAIHVGFYGIKDAVLYVLRFVIKVMILGILARAPFSAIAAPTLAPTVIELHVNAFYHSPTIVCRLYMKQLIVPLIKD